MLREESMMASCRLPLSPHPHARTHAHTHEHAAYAHTLTHMQSVPARPRLCIMQNHLMEMEARRAAGPTWDTVRYMIAQIQYGGRITDDFDALLMRTYAARFFHQVRRVTGRLGYLHRIPFPPASSIHAVHAVHAAVSRPTEHAGQSRLRQE